MLVILFLPSAGETQSMSLGIKGGIPITEAFETGNAATLTAPATQVSYTSRAKPFTVGPAIEVSLPRGLVLEFDALYKRLNYNFSMSRFIPGSPGFPVPGLLLLEEEHNLISRWDLPLLLKYRLRNIASYRPYFSAGFNTNYIVNTTSSGIAAAYFTGVLAPGPITLPPPTTDHNAPSELRYRSAEGFVAAGGVEFSFHHVRVAPELRYTRWAHANFHEANDVGKLRSNLDQAEVLVTLGLAKN
jgi:hypothetical protein